MPVTSAEGLPAPTPGDATNVPGDMQSLTAALGTKVIPTFASTAARDAALGASGAPVRLAIVGNDLWMRRPTWQIINTPLHTHAGLALLGTAVQPHQVRTFTSFDSAEVGNVAGQPSRWFRSNPFTSCLMAVQIATVNPNTDVHFEFNRAESSMSNLVFWARNRAGALVTSGTTAVTMTLWGA